MIRTSLVAALLIAATGAVSAATPYPGTISRWQDNADNMMVSATTVATPTQTFGAPQGMRGLLADRSSRMNAASSIERNSGTSSDRFQDNADTGR